MSPSLSSKIKNERENTPDSLEEGLGDQLVVHVHSCGGAELSRAEHAADRFCILREHEMRGIQMVINESCNHCTDGLHCDLVVPCDRLKYERSQTSKRPPNTFDVEGFVHTRGVAWWRGRSSATTFSSLRWWAGSGIHAYVRACRSQSKSMASSEGIHA